VPSLRCSTLHSVCSSRSMIANRRHDSAHKYVRGDDVANASRCCRRAGSTLGCRRTSDRLLGPPARDASLPAPLAPSSSSSCRPPAFVPCRRSCCVVRAIVYFLKYLFTISSSRPTADDCILLSRTCLHR